LHDAKPHLLVRRSSGESLYQERREELNILIIKRSNDRPAYDDVSEWSSVHLDCYAAKDPGYRICR
jgi:hypothetical protein